MELETWVNEAAGMFSIKRLTPVGLERAEMVRGGQQFKLTVAERELNHTKNQPDQDPFLNGTFTCLEGGESVPVSPNRLTEADIDALVEGHWKTAQTRLGEVTSVAVLDRVFARAVSRDAGQKRLQLIRDRIGELDPGRVFANHVRNVASSGAEEIPAPQEASFYDMNPRDAVTITPGLASR